MNIRKIGMIDGKLLTHKFLYNNNECLIGKFDLENLELDLSKKTFNQLDTEILMQLNNSGVFTLEEMEHLAMMDSRSFINYIIEL